MGHFNLFLFTLLAVSSILPSALAFPLCHTNRTSGGYGPSLSYSLPPSRTFIVTHSPPPISQPESTSSPLPTTSSNPGGSTPSSDIQTFLDEHNTFRALHGADPLTWNDTLSSKAKQWAANCKMVHSGGQLGPYGENLAAGTGTSYDIAAAIKSWTDEGSHYDPKTPMDSGHFTQVVWKKSKELGCALQICNSGSVFDASFGLTKLIVCEYFPQGNIIGQFIQNVQA